MDPSNIPFNTLIARPTNLEKKQFLTNQLCGPFCGRFNYVMLIYSAFAYNKTFYRFAGKRETRFSSSTSSIRWKFG